MAAGAADADLYAAICAVVELGGGHVAVQDGRVLAALPLPIAGLLSDQPFEAVCAGVEAMRAAAHALGSPLSSSMMPLSFLALPVIPELKLTDRGLFDVSRFGFVPLFLD